MDKVYIIQSRHFYADVAQSVEHFLGTEEVVSSILAISSSFIYRCNSVGLECPSDTRVVSGSNPLICTIRWLNLSGELATHDRHATNQK